MIGKIVGWGAAFVALVLLAGVGYRAQAQRRVARTLAIHSDAGIDEGLFIRLGGVEQWIQIRSEDRRNPVILMLHGGPGMSYVPFAPFFRAWEKQFTVVQWDRRGVGKTYARNGEAGAAITFDQLSRDGIELVDSLRARLGCTKVILVGHSVGSAIGVLMASRRPDLFHAYVGTDQIADFRNNERVSYELLKQRANTLTDSKLKQQIESLEAPPYTNVDWWFEKQRLISATDPVAASFENGLFKLIATAPGYAMTELMAIGKGLKFSAAALLREMMTFDVSASASRFDVPVFFFLGRRDVLDPTELAVAYFERLTAPAKALVVFEDAGHNALFMRSDRFLQELVTRVRPLAEVFPTDPTR